jgi:hypothetical protein
VGDGEDYGKYRTGNNQLKWTLDLNFSDLLFTGTWITNLQLGV